MAKSKTTNNIIDDFFSLEKKIGTRQKFSVKHYNETIALIHLLTLKLSELSKEYSKEDLRQVFDEVRNIHSKSSFINRIQNWPEGYQGDYLTIERICSSPEIKTYYNIEDYLERYALNCSISQQHRNKIQIQAMNILEKLNSKNASILICACGSAYDLRMIQSCINVENDNKIVLNDMDINALNYSKLFLSERTLEKTEFDKGNIVTTLKNIHKNYDSFSLILFGGLFDYLTDKQIVFSLKASYSQMRKGGKILFTNIALNNPFGHWIEICGNWHLIERSERHNIKLCEMAGIEAKKVKQYKDYSGLTNIVEIVK